MRMKFVIPFLVPKLSLGTHLSSKLCFATEGNGVAGDNFIPKQSLGTRETNPGFGSCAFSEGESPSAGVTKLSFGDICVPKCNLGTRKRGKGEVAVAPCES